MKHRKGKLYIRRYKENDKSASWMTAIEVAAHLEIAAHRGHPGKVYVAVRHGDSWANVIASGLSKLEVKRRFARPWKKTQRFFRERKRAST